jgi:hypothetical protein
MIVNRPERRAKVKIVVLGGVLGTIVSSLPVVARLMAASINREGDGQLGLGLVILLTIAGSVGTVSGIIGGFIYSAGQPLTTAAFPCLGVVVGTVAILIMGFDLDSAVLVPIVGCILGTWGAVLIRLARSR